MATCYRHPSRETGVSCSSCGRPICPDCMTPTQVGMRCPECARQRTKVVRMRELASVPWVTYALIAVNVFAFLAEGNLTVSGGGVGGGVYLKGALLGSSEILALAGQGVAHGQWWRLLTSGFLHENIIHIGFNMWILYILGQMLEPALGSVKFAAIYFVSLLAGSFGALLVSPHVLTVGASGAVFGLMGAAAVEMRARQIPVMQSGIGMLIAFNLVISFTLPGISWGGHVGGLIAGAIAALVLQLGDRYRAPALALAACAVIAAAAAAGSIATAKSSEVESLGPQQLQLQFPSQ
ncbi:MAG TPA: rhomboid family intramembrane serine protease [Solirubrobacteraceae bacterium]|jgi:membrane associated rhomboid family serine protease|nr:rhomboid family intramembrane serine protease [Solirubrobacteraceae bacterium]